MLLFCSRKFQSIPNVCLTALLRFTSYCTSLKAKPTSYDATSPNRVLYSEMNPNATHSSTQFLSVSSSPFQLFHHLPSPKTARGPFPKHFELRDSSLRTSAFAIIVNICPTFRNLSRQSFIGSDILLPSIFGSTASPLSLPRQTNLRSQRKYRK